MPCWSAGQGIRISAILSRDVGSSSRLIREVTTSLCSVTKQCLVLNPCRRICDVARERLKLFSLARKPPPDYFELAGQSCVGGPAREAKTPLSLNAQSL
jgi:hypothetical protein